MSNTSEYNDMVAFHPGYYIADIIDDMGISQAAAMREMMEAVAAEGDSVGGVLETVITGMPVGVGAVVGANSFVNKDVPQYAVAVGSPAKIIKYRYTEDQIKKIQESKYWEMSPREARKTTKRYR